MRARIPHNVGDMQLIRVGRASQEMSEDMSHDLTDRAGFDHQTRHQRTAQQRTVLALIASVALALSTAVAVTAVSIGMARAGALRSVADGDNAPFAVAVFLGLVLAGMGGLTAVVTRNERKPPTGPGEAS